MNRTDKVTVSRTINEYIAYNALPYTHEVISDAHVSTLIAMDNDITDANDSEAVLGMFQRYMKAHAECPFHRGDIITEKERHTKFQYRITGILPNSGKIITDRIPLGPVTESHVFTVDQIEAVPADQQVERF